MGNEEADQMAKQEVWMGPRMEKEADRKRSRPDDKTRNVDGAMDAKA